MTRIFPISALLAVALLAGCPASTPNSTTSITRPAVSSTPTPSASPASAAVQRMLTVSPWVRHNADTYEMSFIFTDADAATVTFSGEKIIVKYAFSPPHTLAPLAQGQVTMADSTQKFPVDLGSDPPSTLSCLISADLPDGRTLHKTIDIPID